MHQLLRLLGNLAGLGGVLLCLFAGVVRLLGQYHIHGYEIRTLFLGGIALMVMACLIKLHQLGR